ncbi:hypothetical protein [Conexibacter arvalis]|uniref:Uncharacterized protein n=1 Tax=Conexibacter arvalis TaxID=912552 RepID=A0A840IH92_9ACTN|nr:hypothetical protein [Conexibacter arvalis]MBB4663434.1 hypothetical protein [Conexibacter arvalis]
MSRGRVTRPLRSRPLPLALLLLLVAVAAVTSAATLAMLAPAAILLVLLLAGRAPGEDLLLRWRGVLPRRRRHATAVVARGHRAVFVRARTRMSASALAMRPPPAVAALSQLP